MTETAPRFEVWSLAADDLKKVSYRSLMGAIEAAIAVSPESALLDLVVPGGPHLPTRIIVEVLRQFAARDRVFLFTARVLPHLPSARRSQSERFESESEDPLFIWDSSSSQTVNATSQTASAIAVATQLIEDDIYDQRDPLPTRILTRRLDMGSGNLHDILTTPESTLIHLSGVGRNTVADLDGWVRRRTKALGREMSLRAVRETLGPRETVDRGETTRSIPQILESLPERLLDTKLSRLGGLGTRARNVFERRLLHTIRDLIGMRDEEFVLWRGFGSGCLRTLKAALSGLADVDSRVGRPEDHSDIRRAIDALPVGARGLPITRLKGLPRRAENALTRHGAQVVGDIRSWTDEQMLDWPNFGTTTLAALRDSIQDLKARIAGIPDAESMATDAMLRRMVTDRPLLDHIDEARARMSDTEALIFDQRTIAPGEAAKLQRLGDQLDLSRERVRQIENTVCRGLDTEGLLASECDRRLTELRAGRSSPLDVEELPRCDPWFSGAADSPRRFKRVLRALDCDHAVAQLPEGPYVVVPAGIARLDPLLAEFRSVINGTSAGTDVDRLAGQFLVQKGAPELAPVLSKVARDVVSTDDGLTATPTIADRVESVLRAADGPLHVDEIEKRLKQSGFPVGDRTVRACVSRTTGIPLGGSRYVHPKLLSDWDRYGPELRKEVQELLEADTDRQWKSQEILRVLRDSGLPWAHGMEPHVVEYLLGQSDEFTSLGRSMWALAAHAKDGRRPLAAVMSEVLTEHGGPLPYTRLYEEVRRRRGVGKSLSIRWPIVRLPGEGIGLGFRDLGVSEDDYYAFTGPLRNQLEAEGGRLDADQLRSLYCSTTGRHESPDRVSLARLAASVHSSIALDGDGDGIRRSDLPKQRAPAVPGGPNTSSEDTAPVAAGSLRSMLPTFEAPLPIDEIADAVFDRLGVRWPKATIRMRLRSAGWWEDSEGLWRPAAPG